MQILQRLVKKGLLNPADVPRLAEARGANNNRPLHELAIERGLVKEEDVLVTLAEEFGMEFVDLTNAKVDPDTIKNVPLKLELNGFTPDPYGGQRAGFSATAEISRSEFGVDIQLPMDGGGVVVSDKVQISLEIEAVLS